MFKYLDEYHSLAIGITVLMMEMEFSRLPQKARTENQCCIDGQ